MGDEAAYVFGSSADANIGLKLAEDRPAVITALIKIGVGVDNRELRQPTAAHHRAHCTFTTYFFSYFASPPISATTSTGWLPFRGRSTSKLRKPPPFFISSSWGREAQ